MLTQPSLRTIKLLTGMKVNLSKTKMMGIHVDSASLTSLASCLGCSTETTPSSYLGLPLYLGKPKKNMWNNLIQRFTWKFAP
ncbi:hypothetical protein AMTRI_Chr11g98620 [Amborella trichopoda]